MGDALFRDRTEAGQKLVPKLVRYRDRPDVLVLALPRGGVLVGFEVAGALKAPLDIFLVRKLGVPGQKELALGAISSGGVRVVDNDLVRALGIPEGVIDALAAEEQQELERRERVYRRGHSPLPIRGQIAILVDDGIATGSTMRAAITALRAHGPARIVVAVPVAPPSTAKELRSEVDELVCVAQPERFSAIGQWYEDFSQTRDEEVEDLLRQGRDRASPRQS